MAVEELALDRDLSLFEKRLPDTEGEATHAKIAQEKFKLAKPNLDIVRANAAVPPEVIAFQVAAFRDSKF